MPPFSVLLAFLATTALFACMPGPAMLFAAAQTLAGGRWAGLMAALGLHLGGYLHVVLAAAGLSILFGAVPALYTAVKLAGAGYLIWLGLRMWGRREADDAPAVVPKTGRRAFLESVTVEVLNPKTALFFLAFLPQFIDPAAAAPVWVQFLLLGTMVNLIFSMSDIVCVMLASSVRAALERSSRGQRLIRRAGGSVLVGLGAHLVLQRS